MIEIPKIHRRLPDPFYVWVSEFVTTNRLETVLDVGCGEGTLLEGLPSGSTGVGIELSPKRARVCTEKGLRVVRGNGLILPFADDSFDLVVAKDMIEDVRDPVSAVREFRRVTRRFLFVTAPGPWTHWAWDNYMHVRPYTLTALSQLIEDQDLEVLFAGSSKRKWPYRLLAWLLREPVDDISVCVCARKTSL